jgi:hypothetical protein
VATNAPTKMTFVDGISESIANSGQDRRHGVFGPNLVNQRYDLLEFATFPIKTRFRSTRNNYGPVR